MQFSAGTKTYVTDGIAPASPVLKDGSAVYTPGVSERRGSTSSFYHADALGSTRAISNSSQSTTDTMLTDAFGNNISRTGSNPTPFGFAGQWQYQADNDSGLMLLGNRYYDAEAGRFLSKDPIKSGDNWYAYCRNNPLKWVDPEGLIHVVVHFEKKCRCGVAKIFADTWDLIPVGFGNVPIFFIPAFGGELIGQFPISNNVPYPENPPVQVGGGGYFPRGEFPITDIEGPHDSMGPRYPVTRGNHPAGRRGTWLHGGAGERWVKGTGGCIRAAQSSVNWLCWLLELNDHDGSGGVSRGDGHRITY